METNAEATPENTEIHDLSDVERKMRFTGTVMKTSLAGALVDIGVEIPGVVHISQLQEEPVNRVEDVVQVGQEVEVWVKRVIPKKKRLELTMLEPLNLEWREIKQDMVLKGKVVRLEKFGAFIDIGALAPGDNSGAAIAAIPVIKEEYGLPTGCAIHNVVEKSKWLEDFPHVRKTVDASSNINIPLFGGDFAIFGPVENSDIVFPIVAWQDILISEYTENYFGITPNDDHPRRKLLK